MPNNYTIEGNINFQEELYKLLDEDSEDEDTLCQITSLPLKDKSVTLECKHHFNYDALYNEIHKQKYEFKTYDTHTLTKKELRKYNDSKLDYFIKCPYCRSIQFTILPYYEELGLKKVYGINSLDPTLKTAPFSTNKYGTSDSYQPKLHYGNKDYTLKLLVKPLNGDNVVKKLQLIMHYAPDNMLQIFKIQIYFTVDFITKIELKT